LQILNWEAEAGKIDSDLVRLFTEQKVYQVLDEGDAEDSEE